ncbi:MAG: hypothetical protein QM831_39980 [Kofleriaceae bacterium]
MRALALVALAACSYTHPADVPNTAGGDGGMRDGSVTHPDGFIFQDAPPGACNAKAAYANPDLGGESIQSINQMSVNIYEWAGAITNGNGNIFVAMAEQSMVPPFMGQIKAGTYAASMTQIYGLRIYLQFAPDGAQNYHDWYEADTGIFKLTQVPRTDAKLSGSFMAVHLVHVETDTTTYTPTDTVIDDGCTSQLDLDFSVASP